MEASLNGVAKRTAGKVNQTFILEQRAEMRERLVQAAMDGVLKFNAAALEGFWRGGAGGFRAADTARLDTSTFVNRFDHYNSPPKRQTSAHTRVTRPPTRIYYLL